MRCFVIMGVSGSGKSTIGAMVAERIGARYLDGDDLHPDANIDKMSRGIPLQDGDRWPWLDLVGHALAETSGPVVIGCSALKRAYRDRICDKAGEPVLFLYLSANRDILTQRMTERTAHFMPLSLLESQLADLEPPDGDEVWIAESIAATPEQIAGNFAKTIGEEWA